MSNFNIGDVVRIGKGKVEYVVAQTDADNTTVESLNTGKAQVVETARLTLLRAAETEPMNAPVARKNPRAGLVNVNPLKPIGSKRAKVRQRVKLRRTALNVLGAQYNAMRKHGYTIKAA